MNPLPEPIRTALRSAGVDEQQVLESGGSPADGGDYLMDPELVVDLLASALRSLHSVNPAPVTASDVLTAAEVLTRAELASRSADPPALDPAYGHMERERLLEILAEGAERLGEFPDALLVVSHGAPGPDSLRCTGREAVGFVGWEGASLADPHRDLAHAATAVASNLGPMLVPVLFERYGVRPDPRRLDWWALAQQLTGTAATSRGAAHG